MDPRLKRNRDLDEQFDYAHVCMECTRADISKWRDGNIHALSLGIWLPDTFLLGKLKVPFNATKGRPRPASRRIRRGRHLAAEKKDCWINCQVARLGMKLSSVL